MCPEKKICNYALTKKCKATIKTAAQRQADREGTLTTAVIQTIMSEEKANQKTRLKIPMERIRKYFPQSYTAAQIEDAVVKLCERDYRRRTDRER